ncbi:MAG: hypothetical protein VX519_00035 [Myxococcota bacterium]|nr:hypothetical protein [Myxococcota bacterium]
MMYGILLVSLLGGCRGFIDRQTTCGFDVYDWWPGLATHVNKDRDAIFDYNPEDEPKYRVSGSYDPSPGSGEFQFLVEYSGGYFIEKSISTGYGTVYFGGDLDVIYETVTRDSLGEDVKTRVREKRHQCSGLKKYSDVDSGDTWVLNYDIVSDDEVVSEVNQEEGSYSYSLRRQERSDYSIVESVSVEDGDYSSESVSTEWITGIQESNWSQEDSSERLSGTTYRYFDGSEQSDYTWELDGESDIEISSEYTYEGVGTSLYTFEDGSTCELEVDEELDCSYECSSGLAASTFGSGGDC